MKKTRDYAILQSSSMIISELKNYNILYAGWTAYPDYSLNGYAAIGHPGGDVQKVLIENGNGQIPSSGKSVDYYFDKGVPEEGFSGGPVFNSNKKVVGWLSRSAKDANCANVGTSYNITKCGRFNRLFFNISQYIDPQGLGQWGDSEITPPIVTVPTHCKNCIQDSDETGIDCGGSCLPCGMQDVKTLKSQADITDSNISARYELITDPAPGYQLEFVSGNFNLTAGNSIKFKNNTTIKAGVTLKAAILPALMSEPPQGCQDACFTVLAEFTPNGDGINDYWAIRQAFARDYSFTVFDKWNQEIASQPRTKIYMNGVINAWDGRGASSNGQQVKIALNYTDCNGNSIDKLYFVAVWGLKSVSINEFQDGLTENDTEIDGDIFKIIAYPNPTSGKVLIESYNCDLIFDYVLTDMTGKILTQVSNVSGSGEVDLSAYLSGVYLLRVKTGENIQLLS